MFECIIKFVAPHWSLKNVPIEWFLVTKFYINLALEISSQIIPLFKFYEIKFLLISALEFKRQIPSLLKHISFRNILHLPDWIAIIP